MRASEVYIFCIQCVAYNVQATEHKVVFRTARSLFPSFTLPVKSPTITQVTVDDEDDVKMIEAGPISVIYPLLFFSLSINTNRCAICGIGACQYLSLNTAWIIMIFSDMKGSWFMHSKMNTFHLVIVLYYLYCFQKLSSPSPSPQIPIPLVSYELK